MTEQVTPRFVLEFRGAQGDLAHYEDPPLVPRVGEDVTYRTADPGAHAVAGRVTYVATMYGDEGVLVRVDVETDPTRVPVE